MLDWTYALVISPSVSAALAPQQTRVHGHSSQPASYGATHTMYTQKLVGEGQGGGWSEFSAIKGGNASGGTT